MLAATRDPARLTRIRMVRRRHGGEVGRGGPRLGAHGAGAMRGRSTSSTTWCTRSVNPVFATPTAPPPETSPPQRKTPVCAASSTSAASFRPTTELSEHLTSRAEVADALNVDGGPEVVWLGAAVIFGAGSTSFEMLRYVGDRFPVIPIPTWMDNPIDPISIRDVLHYLVAAADPERVPPGAYDIAGPDTTSYRELLKTYARISGKWHTGVPVLGNRTPRWPRGSPQSRCRCPTGWPPTWSSRSTIRCGPAARGLRDLVPDPPGGLLSDRGRDRRWRCRTAGRDRSTRWPTRTISPTAIRPGPVATRCGCSGSLRS